MKSPELFLATFAALVLSSCGGSTSAELDAQEEITDPVSVIPNVTSVSDLSPDDAAEGYIEFVEHGDGDETGYSEPNKYRMYIGNNEITYDAGWRASNHEDAEYVIENFEINGEAVDTIYAQNGGIGETETIFGVLQKSDDEIIVFQNIYFDSDAASASTTTVTAGEVYPEFEDFFVSIGASFDDEFTRFSETTGSSSSYTMNDVSYQYVTMDPNGQLRAHEGYNGSAQFDAASGIWSADLGVVDLNGNIDGVYISGEARWNDVIGSFNGTSTNVVEYLLEDPNANIDGHTETIGTFSGANGDVGFAGSFHGSDEVTNY